MEYYTFTFSSDWDSKTYHNQLFFSGVDIDQVLRKEPHLDCITPSNPQGLMKGYNIRPGVTLDIHTIIEKTNGKLMKVDSE